MDCFLIPILLSLLRLFSLQDGDSKEGLLSGSTVTCEEASCKAKCVPSGGGGLCLAPFKNGDFDHQCTCNVCNLIACENLCRLYNKGLKGSCIEKKDGLEGVSACRCDPEKGQESGVSNVNSRRLERVIEMDNGRHKFDQWKEDFIGIIN